MTEDDRKILEAVERRKVEGEDTCDSCEGTGRNIEEPVCTDCLGQGGLLFEHEYQALLVMTGQATDDILDAEIIG